MTQGSTMESRTILHVDMDAFYASVEQRERPELKGQPVIVGADPKAGKGRGVVAACSYEAREYGIHSALPISRAWKLCPTAIYVRPNGPLYSQVSGRIMQILQHFTDLVEPISIDEAFLDVTGSSRLFGDGESIARAIKDRVWMEQELTCSVGVASNKMVAKMASEAGKPDGLCRVPRGAERDFLAGLPIRKMWGVGPRSEERLKGWKVLTIGDIARQERSLWVKRLGQHGDHLWHLSQGIDDRPVQSCREVKSVSHEATFETDCGDFEEIARTLLALSEKVARRCRKQGLAARCVRLKWRSEDFSTFTRQRKLGHPTQDAERIFAVALDLSRSFLPLLRAVRLVGVGVSGLGEQGSTPRQALLEDLERRKRRLDDSVDRIAERFGEHSIGKASLLDRHLEEDEGGTSFTPRSGY